MVRGVPDAADGLKPIPGWVDWRLGEQVNGKGNNERIGLSNLNDCWTNSRLPNNEGNWSMKAVIAVASSLLLLQIEVGWYGWGPNMLLLGSIVAASFSIGYREEN